MQRTLSACFTFLPFYFFIFILVFSPFHCFYLFTFIYCLFFLITQKSDVSQHRIFVSIDYLTKYYLRMIRFYVLLLCLMSFVYHFGRLNAFVISAICSSLMPSGSSPMFLAAM